MAATNPSYYQSGVCQDIKQKEHLFHLYMNQIAEGTPNANQKDIVNPSLPMHFGVTVANDWTISDGPAANANPIARARGMHMGDGKANVNWLFCHNILLLLKIFFLNLVEFFLMLRSDQSPFQHK